MDGLALVNALRACWLRRVLAARRLGGGTLQEGTQGRPPCSAAATSPGNTAPCSLEAVDAACMAALGGGHAPRLGLLQHLPPAVLGAVQVVLPPPGACRREAFTSPPAWPRRRGGGHPSGSGGGDCMAVPCRG